MTPLRVALVTNFMPPHAGGIETMSALLADGLRERGHSVRWVASAEPALPGHDARVTRVRAWNPLEARFQVPLPLWGPRAVASLTAAIRHADVVHVHECINVTTWDALLIARALRRPTVLTQHVGLVPYDGMLDRVQRLAYRTAGLVALGMVDARVAVSPHVAEWFRSWGVRSAFDVIANARDERVFRPATSGERSAARQALGVTGEGQRVVLYAARLVGKKGVDRVAALWPDVARRHPGWQLVVVGSGPLAGRLASLQSTNHLGQRPLEAMPALFAAADAFWLPSRGEGFPLTVQEALLCDVPVVVSDDPSYLANLEGTSGAWLCGDSADMGAALEAAVASRRDGTLAAAASRRWARASMVESYLAVYRRVLAQK